VALQNNEKAIHNSQLDYSLFIRLNWRSCSTSRKAAAAAAAAMRLHHPLQEVR
jgi:hypothetical protein